MHGFQYFPLRSAIAADELTTMPDKPGRTVPPVWLFVGRVKGLPYREGDFGGKLARAAYRLSERFVTPHLLRSIYAVYAIETMGDRSTLASLAEAMGHTLATLDRVYDKRRADRKMRLAEVALRPHLDRICAGLPTTVQRPQSLDLSTLASQVQQLPPQQRQQLAALL
jgi:integrase